MAYKVLWTEHALEDTKEIIRYIAKTLDSPIAAREHLEAFEQAVKSIELFPKARAISVTPSLRKRELRCFPVKKYLMLYRIQNVSAIIIYRVFHSTQDYARIIDQADNTDS
ncbi:MAG: type II toxin-antitoxin system RelE/ParE family toxin [Coriobacteriales bacterium]|nr:type II toxin-antitoxin system RelE/ParE family toxin [Coriobacteriales bacterium]